MATSTVLTNKPINPRWDDNRPVDSYNRASLYSGKALDFDGVNDYVDLAGLTFSGNNQSFCFYLKADAWNNFDYIFDIFSNRFIIGSQPANNLSIYDGASWQSFGEIDDTINTNFFVVTIEGTTSKAYLNGVQFGSNLTIALRDFSAANECALMSQYDGVQQFFPGKMSGFKAFEVALTATQVADLYNNPEKVVPTGVDNTALKLWLPMMEGAGTTAYDGSGNGNHGTISGATYVNGVGAPVAQSAVMDWNKGTNILEYSIWNNSYWTASGGVVTDGVEAPDGTNTAFKFERDDASSGAIYNVAPTGLSGTNYRYVYAKLPSGSASASAQLLNHNTNTNNTFTITDQWQRFEVDSSPLIPTNFYIVDFRDGVGVDEIHLWAPQAAAGTDESVFVPTIGTAQGSEVLLPQGLTSGRDITGVNLFENVRKQGALNLDGNSWAEVHDNASLDITDAITLEAWVYNDGTETFKGVLAKWGTQAGVDRCYMLYKQDEDDYRFDINGTSLNTGAAVASGWNHLVGVWDSTSTNKYFYVNGTLSASTTQSATIVTSTKPVEIGRYGYTSNNAFDDQIAQPRIYNRALTASEVLNNFNATKDLYI